MTIAVTGGSGKLGRTVVRVLRGAGNEVVNLDWTGERAAGFVQTDLTDYGQTIDALMGVDEHPRRFDAVVHLAAIPAPGLRPDADTFHNNITVTYNVLRAAIRAGVRTIVTASSETVLGLPFDVPPPYIPVDEECTRPESNYSLAKHLEEQLAVELVRWHPDVSIQALRFSNVMDPSDYAEFPTYDSDPLRRKWNLWGYIDARDGAQAVLRAIERGRREPGFERYIIAAADTVMSRPNAELVGEVFPGVEIRGDLGVNDTLLSIDKARSMLGFEPEYSWRRETAFPA
ncbi:NAD(P)-dependent oxidoreductase [Microbacterium sp. QXD-8]|uniref:NAD(P)-dependent oxidoreductase n=1 Tax=Microbacterium psychrotolerans TaxID=3068321 RepID=A0ABU0YZF2_9MICO|nr:NAD(P)-dependent oxidoreductase [Microbacterium sp. QXD-8]MDQ7876631.1 NAD(P)-dependent oxidoreductase [Microbacterium sp. QXD-8]